MKRILFLLAATLCLFTCKETTENPPVSTPIIGEIIEFSVADQRQIVHELHVDNTTNIIRNEQTLPDYVNLSQLVVFFKTNNEKEVVLKLNGVTQTSGVNNVDFTDERVYDLYVSGEKQKSFKVWITKEPLLNSFLTFNFSENSMASYQPAINIHTGEITNEKIVPLNVDITALKPEFTTTGENTVVKVNGTVQKSGENSHDFSKPVIYTVEGEDGTSKNFTVKIIKSTLLNNFLTFSFPESSMASCQPTINVETSEITNENAIPSNIDITALKPEFTTTGENTVVKVNGEVQTSGVSVQDFTNPVVYTVEGADGTSKNFTVILNIKLVLSNNFLTFSFSESSMASCQPTINVETGEITNENIIPATVNITALKPVFTTTGENTVVKVNGVVQTSGVSAQSFVNRVVYTVEGEDGTSKNFTVTLKRYFTNPVAVGSYADPTVMYDKDKKEFFMYVTGNIVRGYRSKDLIKWDPIKGTASEVFTSKPNFTGDSGAGMWAPDINYFDGKYVMYYSMSVWGGGATCGIGVGVCTRPEGPFIPPTGNPNGKLFVSSEIGVHNSIDPCFFEENGKRYLFWGSWNGIYMTELTEDGMAVKDLTKKAKVAGNSFEAVYIHKRDNIYYMFASIGACCDGFESSYKVVVGRSAALQGPYKSSNGTNMTDFNAWNPSNYQPILVRGDGSMFGAPGHNARIITDDNGDDWMLCHSYVNNGTDSRNLVLNKIEWTLGWPVLGSGTPSASSVAPVFK